MPKRSAGSDFSRSDYRAARKRAIEVARTTLGDDVWANLQHDGYLELPSTLFDGITYRLRVGRRIEVRAEPQIALFGSIHVKREALLNERAKCHRFHGDIVCRGFEAGED